CKAELWKSGETRIITHFYPGANDCSRASLATRIALFTPNAQKDSRDSCAASAPAASVRCTDNSRGIEYPPPRGRHVAAEFGPALGPNGRRTNCGRPELSRPKLSREQASSCRGDPIEPVSAAAAAQDGGKLR